MSAVLSGLSASVTRILYLTGFPKELKTKDIQSAFSEWESVNGGFKIKWRDDTSLLIVFQDATVAKRAYLHTIANPPPILTSEAGVSATIKPYDGPDAQNVIQNVNARGQHNSNPSRSHNARSNSISVFPGSSSHGRIASGGNGNGTISNSNSTTNFRNGNITIPEHAVTNGREPSPTLPNIPSHPTLNALINSSLSEVALSDGAVQADPAILATSLQTDATGAPRIGNPGKRMLGAALGVRHPALGPRVVHGGNHGGVEQAIRGMGGLTVTE